MKKSKKEKRDKSKKKTGKVAGKKKRDTGGFPELLYYAKRAPSQGGNIVADSLDAINENMLVGVYKLRRPTYVEVRRRLVRNPKEPKGTEE